MAKTIVIRKVMADEISPSFYKMMLKKISSTIMAQLQAAAGSIKIGQGNVKVYPVAGKNEDGEKAYSIVAEVKILFADGVPESKAIALIKKTGLKDFSILAGY